MSDLKPNRLQDPGARLDTDRIGGRITSLGVGCRFIEILLLAATSIKMRAPDDIALTSA